MVLDCDNGLIHNDFVGHQHLTLNSIWKIRTLDTPREASPKGCPGGGGGGGADFGILEESLHLISVTILIFQTTTVYSLKTSLIIIRKNNYKKMGFRGLNGA